MKAHKLPSGSWRVQVQINGVRRSFTAKSKKEAERAALESILNRPEAPTIDFRHAVEYFIANRENVLSASTAARYKRIVKKYMISPCICIVNTFLEKSLVFCIKK